MLRALPSNGRCLQSHRLTAGLYATTCNYVIIILIIIGSHANAYKKGRLLPSVQLSVCLKVLNAFYTRFGGITLSKVKYSPEQTDVSQPSKYVSGVFY
jgi:hypothetical protein